MPEQKYVLLCRSKAAAAESQCLLGPLAFGEFPAENTRAWEAERGADKPQTTSTSCISSMHGTFYIWTHDIPTAGGKGWGVTGVTQLSHLSSRRQQCQGGQQPLLHWSCQWTQSILSPLRDGNVAFMGWKGAGGVDSGLLCVSKVVNTLEATSHLSASP